MSPSKQITSEFVHCGLGYSNGRRGMLVVENNAVSKLPIKVKAKPASKLEDEDEDTKSISSQEMKAKVLLEIECNEKPDKVQKNIQSIRAMQEISKLMSSHQQKSVFSSTGESNDSELPECMKQQRPKINNKHLMLISNT